MGPSQRFSEWNCALDWHEHPARNSILRLIVTLDMGKEVFYEMMPPNPSSGSIAKGMEITALGKSISILEYCFDLRMSLDSCIWVMKVNGVEESWTKLNNIDLVEDWTT